MKLTDQEVGLGLVVVTCKCCGEVYKAHGLQNACTYGATPNYGCDKCQGIPNLPVKKLIKQPDLTIANCIGHLTNNTDKITVDDYASLYSIINKVAQKLNVTD